MVPTPTPTPIKTLEKPAQYGMSEEESEQKGFERHLFRPLRPYFLDLLVTVFDENKINNHIGCD